MSHLSVQTLEQPHEELTDTLIARQSAELRKNLEREYLVGHDNFIDALNGIPEQSFAATLTFELLHSQQLRQPNAPELTRKQLETGIFDISESPVRIGKHTSTTEIDNGLSGDILEVTGHLTKAWRHGAFERVAVDEKGNWYYNSDIEVTFNPVDEWPLRRIRIDTTAEEPKFALYRTPQFTVRPKIVDGHPVPYKEGEEVTVLPPIDLPKDEATNEQLWDQLQILYEHRKALETARAKSYAGESQPTQPGRLKKITSRVLGSAVEK